MANNSASDTAVIQMPNTGRAQAVLRLFMAMRDGKKKPHLSLNNPVHKAVRDLVKLMAQTDTLTDRPKVFYLDAGSKNNPSEADKVRAESYTGIQPITWEMTEYHAEMRAGFSEFKDRVVIVGENPFLRRDKYAEAQHNIAPLAIGPGNFLEAQVLIQSILKRKPGNNYQPLIIYNREEFWEPLLNLLEISDEFMQNCNVHVCNDQEDLYRTAEQHLRYRDTANARAFFNALAKEHAFEIVPGADIANSSNNSKKRYDNARILHETGADVRVHFVGDHTGALQSADEKHGTGAGNAAEKTLDTIRQYYGQRQVMRAQGIRPQHHLALTSDVTIRVPHGLESHPYLAEYKHIHVAGQTFLGSEMAKAEKVTNMDTLIFDIHRAMDDLEDQGIDVDRHITFQTVLNLFPLNQDLPANATIEDAKFIAVAGQQTYILRKTPAPYMEAGNELEAYLSFINNPIESLAEVNARLGHISPDTHTSRAFEALSRIVNIPRKEIEAPFVRKPIERAIVTTDRHFLGTWTKPSDVFGHAALTDFEARGYRFAETGEWTGGQMFKDIREFRKTGDAFAILPYDYSNPSNDLEKLREKTNRELLIKALFVDAELSDQYLRGRPIALLDRKVKADTAFMFRMGLTGRHPLLGRAWTSASGKRGTLAQALDSAWLPHEFVRKPHTITFDPPVIPNSPKAENVALLGSAKSWNLKTIERAKHFALRNHMKDRGVRDGYGGEGLMNAFAQAAVELCAQGHTHHWRYGVTTPLAFIEKEPKGLEGTHLADNYAIMHDMYERAPAIMTADTPVAIGCHGGDGTWEEVFLNIQKTLSGEDRATFLDNTKERYCDKHRGTYDPLLAVYTEEELKTAQIYAYDNAEALLGGVDTFFAERAKRRQTSLEKGPTMG